jgi:hypothetical protein
MKMKYSLFTLLVLGLNLLSCGVQTKTLFVKDLSFESIFATSTKDTQHTYCLLGTGYFRAPMAKNTDSLIQNWIKKHPTAFVIPVSTHGPTLTDHPQSIMTYCWLIDKNDTLNNELIRKGCFPGGTMMRPQTWEEMSEKQKLVYQEKPVMTVHIGAKDYNRFLEQIKEAEFEAQIHKRGIWNKPVNEE